MNPPMSRSVPLLTPLRPAGPGTEYRLSDLLQRHRAGDSVFVTDDVASYCGAHDPLLYTAHRDVLLPRTACDTNWFADLVEYQPGQLPGGELIRSTGHWNTPTQLEIFQTLTGRVLMLAAWRTNSGEPVLTCQTCDAGEMAVIPFGSWHLTLVLDGPAAVFNFYTDLPAETAPPHQAPAAGDRGKYQRAAAVELTAVRAREGFAITGSADSLAVWGAAQPVSEPAWLRDIVAGTGLPDFYRNADSATLAALVAHARRQVPVCHRTDPR
ncbi:hypothetical protein [Micromonospora haikouensis]|uniref:hypothetical protein n=1 Tax=Micromonospora haikouensis TaxID=686309 RepID=UPI003D720C23